MSSFNLFRITGDILHALSNALLIHKIQKSHSCSGISLKTQMMYAFVFMARYVDIFWNFSSWYNWFFKIFYLGTTFYTIYLIAFKYHDSYQQVLDKLPVIYVIVPSFVIGLIAARPWTAFEVFWTGSLILEAVAMLPQFYMLTQSKNIDNFTSDYVAALGGYRFFYILNWIYRSFKGFNVGWINWMTGIIQIFLYAEFFYYWLKSKVNNEQLKLPN
ncbi:ER_lumen protein retaining receptor [Hexamita inflata]|uniref:ER lumen protein retaining receptor n=1 Tax=Hexamita inflata TaxID=28002 RepID=A0AA86V6E9_9EUKA|nr:ER lumen protein retaining receptor [Hexamita inflata]CAI9978206.1 ER lumen protein retaining receptor [Hexamita inflata]